MQPPVPPDPCSKYPSQNLQKICHKIAEKGADLIVCQHSHCIGTYENYKGGHILYGQGNFNFVESVDTEIMKTGVAVCYDTKANTVEFIPTNTNEGSIGVQLVHGEEKENILSAFAERSEKLKTGEWKSGWNEFCERVKNTYLRNIERACLETSSDRENATFGHYLDCEAHTDVWRELFPTYNLTNEKD